ncbi:LAMB1 [Mytilus edulis]|uniref:LAMB1 n=1 Tax=Mytilus edulis TaxID=6550 RepID=A0A8S3Q2U7_MYTED|nr:LAMB1 [Mytilus edulis]
MNHTNHPRYLGSQVIFRALPPFIPIEDPYNPKVQDLLHLTNLRVNFTDLHTLGDTLVDNRLEIKEKYYYAMYEMIVRGSCSCYGHASQCVPVDKYKGKENQGNMVHGKCVCTHNTQGDNCERCLDFYNDLPWKPAHKNIPNACQKCNCNNHATKCHFDPAVYEVSGNLSGGVCDDCQHNTTGTNCQECKEHFLKIPIET